MLEPKKSQFSSRQKNLLDLNFRSEIFKLIHKTSIGPKNKSEQMKRFAVSFANILTIRLLWLDLSYRNI